MASAKVQPELGSPIKSTNQTPTFAYEIPLPSPSLNELISLSDKFESSFQTENSSSGEMPITPVVFTIKRSNIFSSGHIVAEATPPPAQPREIILPIPQVEAEIHRASAASVSQKSQDNLNLIVENSKRIGRENRASILPEWRDEDIELKTPTKAPTGRKAFSIGDSEDDQFENQNRDITPTSSPTGRKRFSIDENENHEVVIQSRDITPTGAPSLANRKHVSVATIDSLFERCLRDVTSPVPDHVLDGIRESSLEIGRDGSIDNNAYRSGGALYNTDLKDAASSGTDIKGKGKATEYDGRLVSKPIESSPYYKPDSKAKGYGAIAASNTIPSSPPVRLLVKPSMLDARFADSYEDGLSSTYLDPVTKDIVYGPRAVAHQMRYASSPLAKGKGKAPMLDARFADSYADGLSSPYLDPITKEITYGPRAVAQQMRYASSPLAKGKGKASDYGSRAASSPLNVPSSPYPKSSPYLKPVKHVRSSSVVHRAISNDALRMNHKNGGIPTTPADAELYKNRFNMDEKDEAGATSPNHLPLQHDYQPVPSHMKTLNAKEYGDLMRSKLDNPIKPLWMRDNHLVRDYNFSMRMVEEAKANRLRANEAKDFSSSPVKKSIGGNPDNASDPFMSSPDKRMMRTMIDKRTQGHRVLGFVEADEDDSHIVAPGVPKKPARVQKRRETWINAQRFQVRQSQTIDEDVVDPALDEVEPVEPKKKINCILRLLSGCFKGTAELSEADDEDIGARIVYESDSDESETTEQRIERRVRTNLTKSSGEPNLLGDIIAGAEFEKRYYSLRRLRPMGSFTPSLIQKWKESESRRPITVPGITDREFLLERFEAEKNGARPPPDSMREPQPYILTRYNIDDDVQETPTEFLIKRHQGERRGFIKAPELPEVLSFSLPQNSEAKQTGSDQVELVNYNRTTGTCLDDDIMETGNEFLIKRHQAENGSIKTPELPRAIPISLPQNSGAKQAESDQGVLADENHSMATRTDVRELSADDHEMVDLREFLLTDNYAFEDAEPAGSSRMGLRRGAVDFDKEEDAESSRMGLRGGAFEYESDDDDDVNFSRTGLRGRALEYESDDDGDFNRMGLRGGTLEYESEDDLGPSRIVLRGGAVDADDDQDANFSKVALRGGVLDPENEDEAAFNNMALRGGALQDGVEDNAESSRMGLRGGALEDDGVEDLDISALTLRGEAGESEDAPKDALAKPIKLSRREKRKAKAREKAWAAAKEKAAAEAEMLDVVMANGTVVHVSSRQLFIHSTTGRSKKQKRRDIKEFGPQEKLSETVTIRGGKPFEVKEGQVCLLRRLACKQWRLKNEELRLKEEAAERAAEKAEKEKEKEQRQLAKRRRMKMVRQPDGTFSLEPAGPNDQDGIDVVMRHKENIMVTVWRNMTNSVKEFAPTYSNC